MSWSTYPEWCEQCDKRDVIINRLIEEKKELEQQLKELINEHVTR